MGSSTSQQRCPGCGTSNPLGERFCAHCGFDLTQPMPGETIASALNPSAPSARRITAALATGTLIGSRYTILRLLGRGGSGAVYLASDTRFPARRVAVKEMGDARLSPGERRQALTNFRQEADLLSRLQHPHLPVVSDFLEEAGKAYMMMDFIEGRTLGEVQDAAGGVLAEALVTGWALQLCEVLAYLHNQPQPIVFRDVKPSNIMLTPANQIKLIDFGIARIFKSSATRDTSSFGSQGYAAPEQYGLEQTDARTDIYALGATLYDLLTGQVPPAAFARKLAPQSMIPLRTLNPQLSPAIEQVILWALQIEKAQRYQSMDEMARALRTSLDGLNSASLPTGLSSPAAPPQSPAGLSRRALLLGGGTVAVAAVAALYVISRAGSPAGASIPLTFACSTEKAPWLQAAARDFNTRQQTVRGQNSVIHIQITDLGSVDGQAQILSGQLKPIAWSPASSLEINRLNYSWQQTHQGASIITYNEQFQPRSLVKSPLVLAVWQERARALLNHYHTSTLDWDNLHSALGAQDWTEVGGKANWGPVKFGQTLPIQSNSGLLTITLLAYHYFRQARGLTVARVNDPGYGQYLHDFEVAVSAFGHSSGTYLEQDIIDGAGPAQADVIATYENLVLTLQEQAQSRQHQPLLIFYPTVNIVSDHPFVVLQGDWVNETQQQAALQFRDFLLDIPQQRQALTYGFRPVHPAVALDDSGILSNPFARLAAIFPNHQPDPLQSLAQAPDGEVVDALIQNWHQRYPSPPTSDG